MQASWAELLTIGVKLLGSSLGGVLSLVFMPPESVTDCIRRMCVALIFGTIFANKAREILSLSLDIEGMIGGSAAAGAMSWWLIGAARKAISTWKINGTTNKKD